MRRYLSSLIVEFVFATMVVIVWAPPAKSGTNGDGDCLEFCKNQAICACAKILGGSLRLTKCNIGAQCVDTVNPGSHCECDIDPICAIWEKDVVVQTFPPESPSCGASPTPEPVCGNGIVEGTEECDTGGESAVCDADCTAAACGDGTVNTTAGEECEMTDPNSCAGTPNLCTFTCICN